MSLGGLTGSQEATGCASRSLGSSCTDGCHYAGTPLFGCRMSVPPKSPMLLVQGSSHAYCAMCCVSAPFVCIHSSNVDTTSRYTRTSTFVYEPVFFFHFRCAVASAYQSRNSYVLQKKYVTLSVLCEVDPRARLSAVNTYWHSVDTVFIPWSSSRQRRRRRTVLRRLSRSSSGTAP